MLEQGSLSRKKGKLKTISFLAIIIVSGLIGARGVMRTLGDESLQKIKPYVPKIVADLEALNLSEQANVQVMDTALGGLQALYQTDLQQTSRMLYDFHFQVEPDHPYVQSLRQDFISDVNAKEPSVVIILDKGWLAPHSYQRHESFPEFLDLLKSDYHLYRDQKDYRIYLRN